MMKTAYLLLLLSLIASAVAERSAHHQLLLPQPRRRGGVPSHHGSAAIHVSSTTTASTIIAQQSVVDRLIAGGVSRAIAQATLYPIDALRTLAQTRDGRTLADVGASALVRGCAQTSCFALFMGSIQFAVFGVFGVMVSVRS